MKKNMGTADRILRIFAALGILLLFVMGTINGVVAIVLGFMAVVFLATSVAGWCPAYVPFGISTRHKPAESAHTQA